MIEEGLRRHRRLARCLANAVAAQERIKKATLVSVGPWDWEAQARLDTRMRCVDLIQRTQASFSSSSASIHIVVLPLLICASAAKLYIAAGPWHHCKASKPRFPINVHTIDTAMRR